ncbi:MAG TPA: hypothetical protein VG756_18270 [Pseudonocardiaceae bacterium]|jgi:hypothetical protein|nr:hypothetical protein [Pseudonocardiaceae bacterium]
MRASVGTAAGAVLVATGLAVAGCASGGSSSAAGPAATPNSSAATGTPGGGNVVAAAYTKTTAAKTAKTTITTQIGSGGQSIPVTANGAIDFARNTADLTETLPMGLGNAQTRFVNGFLYEQLPAAIASRISGGKPWIAINVNQLTQQQTGSTLSQLQGGMPADPADALNYLRGASDDVRTIGPDTVDNTPTTHYAMTLDLNKALANSSPQSQQSAKNLEQQLGGSTLPADVWIDQQGRLRKISFSKAVKPQAAPATTTSGASGAPPKTPTSIAFTETLSDFGTPVSVAAPTAEQTTDITSKVAGQTGGH